ncbi:MAG: PAS domain S-box protein [Magnetococcales bacterium]|nr:PAS domain S-box protein [Magnetococcales bacterium]
MMQCCINTGNLHVLEQMPFEIEAMRRDGAVFPIRLAIDRMEMGGYCYYIATIVDMTEERRLLEEVVQLERTIVDNAPCGIVVANKQGNIVIFNTAAENLFGYRRGEVLGQSLTTLIPEGRLREGHTVGFQACLATGVPNKVAQSVFEVEAKRKDNSVFPIRLAISQTVIGGQPTFVGMIADISNERQLYQELVQSEKMAGLGSMVAGVAHEINTPVGIGVTAASELEARTCTFAELLHREGISEEELNEYIASTTRLVELIHVNLDRAVNLIRSFKSVAVDQSSEELRTFKVKEYVESVVLSLRHELKETRLRVEVICPPDLQIRSYPGLFSQIVINLINNSKIHAFEPNDAGQITIEITLQGDRLRFLYRDNGKGMSEEIRHRIFEPFFTTKREMGGSGLGMFIVYNLVTKTLGGTISCQSIPGQGMSVQIDVPSGCVVSAARATNLG